MGKGARKRTRTARWQKVTALLPLALLSGALSANAATGDRDDLTPAASTNPGVPTVPAEAFQQPASVALPEGSSLPGMTAGLAPDSMFKIATGDAPSSSGRVSPNGIPVSALKAYQRAAAILNQADPGCNIDWSLVAAIGRVESDHGRYGGNVLDEQGKAQPGIYGVPLDGNNGTARILDTDGGAYDNDAVYDRAVGPMQFIPSTWSVAGVDADQDGTQDPQDIDDAATASAVYLCSGDDDLSTTTGERAAVYRYNHSDEYVDLVLSIAASYSGGEYTAVPDGTPSTTTLVPQPPAAPERKARRDTRNRPSGGTVGDTRGGTASSTGGSGAGGGGSSGGSSDGGSGSGSDSGGNGASSDNGGNGGNGGGSPSPSPEDQGPVDRATKKARETVEDTTTPLEEAQWYCQSIDRGPASLSECVDAYLKGGAGAVQNLIGGLLGGIG